MNAVKKTIAALAVASTALVPMVTSAQAHDRGFSHQHGARGLHCGPGDRNCNGRFQRRGQKHHGRKIRGGISGGDAAGIAILGVIGGALIGQALSNQNQPRYVQPQPQYRAPQPTYNSNVYPPAPRGATRSYREPNVITYQGSVEPWSQGWYEYCDARYRSFNPNTGTFRGYDGHDHFCVAK